MSTILAQARLAACRHWPFASHAILSMVPVPRPGLGTLAVDKHWRLYHDDAALERMGVERAAGLILHELDHLLKRHHKRGEQLVGGDKWDTWNYATDAAINSGLRSEGIPLPGGLVYPERFGLPQGLSAEEYFRALDQQTENEPDDGADQDGEPNQDTEPEQDGEGSDEENDDDNPQGDDQADLSQPGDSQLGDAETPPPSDDAPMDGSDDRVPGSPSDGRGGDDSGEPDGCHDGSDDGHNRGPAEPAAGDPNGGGDADDGQNAESAGDGSGRGSSAGEPDIEPQPVGTSGSCSDGRPRPWELGEPDGDNPGLDEADQEQLIRTTAKNALQKSRGEGAAGRRRWAEEILDPPLDPAARLLNLVRRCCDLTVGVGERTYRRPSRRNGDPRMALPSNVAPLPRITVVVDTSGSMSEEDLGLALGMIRKVLNSFRIRDGIKVITGDAKGQTKQLCLSDPKRIELTGGGGTDMARIIAEVLEDRPQPQMILVCSDGWTPWPEENPGIPIVACLSRAVASLPAEYTPPNWITILELKRNLT